MTQIDKLELEIESLSLSARINLATNDSMAVQLLSSDPALCALEEIIRKNPLNTIIILKRIQAISSVSTDYRYENPFDVALAAYAWCLNNISPYLGKLASELILGTPNIWWSNRISSMIINNQPSIVNINALENNIQLIDKLITNDFTFIANSSIVSSFILPKLNIQLKDYILNENNNVYNLLGTNSQIIVIDQRIEKEFEGISININNPSVQSSEILWR